MNQERLSKLKERADQAVKIAAEIETLGKASPWQQSTDIRFRRYGTSADILNDDLLKKCIDKGRLALIAENEALLESLIATEPETLPITANESEVA